MKITIRKAQPDDADFIARSMLESSRGGKKIGIFDLIFDTGDDEVLVEAIGKLVLAENRSHCHYTNFLIAQSSAGERAGLVCGYEPRIATHEKFSAALAELGIDEGYEERLAAYLLCEPEIDKQTWMLDYLSVAEGFEPMPVMKELVQKSLLNARLKGYRKSQTMTEIGSVEPEMAYTKLGFKFQDQKQSDYYKEQFGRPGIKRLGLFL